MSRVLVTGASGFIGRYTLPLLVASGHEVHAVSGREVLDGPAGVHWHRHDLLDPDSASRLFADARPQRLLHLAWFTRHGEFWNSSKNLEWVEASLRLWREFRAGGGERAVVVGSCAEYEWSQPVLSEERTPLRPASVYGAGKDALRRVLERAAATDGSSLAWGRVFFVYGPQRHTGRLIQSVAEALVEGRPALCSGGEQVRDFLHVADTASALVALLESDLEGAVNIGSGLPVTVREVAESLGRLHGRPDLIELGALPRSPGDPPSIVADITRLRDELGWRPRIGLEEGLAETLDSLGEQLRAR